MTTEPQGWIAALANMVPRHRSDTRPAAPVAQEPPAPEGELHEYVAETRKHYRYDTCGICGSGVNDSSRHPVPVYVHSRNPAPTSEGQEAGRVSACRRDKDEHTGVAPGSAQEPPAPRPNLTRGLRLPAPPPNPALAATIDDISDDYKPAPRRYTPHAIHLADEVGVLNDACIDCQLITERLAAPVTRHQTTPSEGLQRITEVTYQLNLAADIRAAVPKRTDEHGPAYWNGLEDGYEQAARFIEKRVGE